MPPPSVLRAASAQRGLVTVQQARALGMTPSALRHALRPGGPWRRVVGAVLATTTGALHDEQRLWAALLHAGPGAMLGGLSACAVHGLQARPSSAVHVLAPHRRRPCSTGFVVVRRTTDLPTPWVRRDLAVAPPARAVVDGCRGLSALGAVRALASEAVQRRLVTVAQLDAELAAGASAGSRLLRTAVEDLRAGTRSAPEAELRRLFLARPLLRHALWNPRLLVGGHWLADPDAYLVEAGLAVEVDSYAWHASIERYEATLARHARMEAAGLRVVHITPRRIGDEPRAVVAEVEAACAAGLRSGPPPGVVALPAR